MLKINPKPAGIIDSWEVEEEEGGESGILS